MIALADPSLRIPRMPGKKRPKPKPQPKSEDRHKFRPLGLRFSRQLIEAMRDLAEKNRRPLTTEITIALENHLTAAGLWPPKATPDAEV